MASETHSDPKTPVDFRVVAGKTAIVTGGALGIGVGHSRALVENGAQVIILDINEAKGREAEMQ